MENCAIKMERDLMQNETNFNAQNFRSELQLREGKKNLRKIFF